MKSKGFTLIELLVVVAIIGILATVVLASLGNARSRAKDATRMSDLKTLQTAYEMYLNDGRGSGNTIPATAWACSTTSTVLMQQLRTYNYVPDIIHDPDAPSINNCNLLLSGTSGPTGTYAAYMFVNYGNGEYCLNARLENTPTNPCVSGQGYCGSYGMNYAVCSGR